MKYYLLIKRDFLLGLKSGYKQIIFALFIALFFTISYFFGDAQKDAYVLVYDLFIPKFDRIEFLKKNIFFIFLFNCPFLIYNKVVLKDLFEDNKLLLARFKSRNIILNTKMTSLLILTFIFFALYFLMSYILLTAFSAENLDMYVFCKIVAIYTLCCISVFLLMILFCMKTKSIIALIFVMICLLLNLKNQNFLLPGASFKFLVEPNFIYLAVDFIYVFIFGIIANILYDRKDLF